MLLEMGLIAGGIPVGWLLRRQEIARKAVGHLLTWTVRVLLFLMGLALGVDTQLLSRIRELGLQAAVISLLALAGSLAAAWLLGRFLRLEAADGADHS